MCETSHTAEGIDAHTNWTQTCEIFIYVWFLEARRFFSICEFLFQYCISSSVGTNHNQRKFGGELKVQYSNLYQNLHKWQCNKLAVRVMLLSSD